MILHLWYEHFRHGNADGILREGGDDGIGLCKGVGGFFL